MDFIDEVRTRSGRFSKRIEHLETEEATKSSLVLPFLQMLGYEIFDPTEVVPEYTADVGTKKGEKVDYVLMQGGKPAVLIECKRYGSNLGDPEISQLLRYFTVTEARFGILTDGITYRFFSDLDQPNVMDPRPFFEFNMLEFTEAQVEELKRFTKASFDLEEIVDAAWELRYTNEIKRILAEELTSPSEEFVRFIVSRVYEGRATQTIRRQFEALAKSAFAQFINDRISVRLKSALEREEGQPQSEGSPGQQEPEEAEQPEFAPTELEALYIIKAICRDAVDVHRIGLRAGSQYCSVLIDDNNRKIICRLRVKTPNLRLGLLNEGRQEQRRPLKDIDDLYTYGDKLRAAVINNTSEDKGSVEKQSDHNESV